MTRLFRVRLGLLVTTLALAFALSACTKNTATPASPTPPVVEPTLTTEDFTGVLAPSDAGVFQFTVTAAGTVTTTLTEPGPNDPVVLGMSVGLWDPTAATCNEIVKNESAQSGTAIVGRAEPGTFCARVYDVGNVVGTAAYSLQVIHP